MSATRVPWWPALRLCLQQARAPSRTRAHPGSKLCVSTAAKSKAAKTYAPNLRRYIPDNAQRFVKNGQLLTSRENVAFLREHGLEPDNGKMMRFTPGAVLHKMSTDYKIVFGFSPKHIIHPFNLRYFEAKGHPMAAMIKAKYARKTREQPLWVMVTSRNGASAVVRTMTFRSFAKEVYRALEALGYRSAPGKGAFKEIRGTFWATLNSPIHAASLPPEEFGKAVAAALDKECSQGIK